MSQKDNMIKISASGTYFFSILFQLLCYDVTPPICTNLLIGKTSKSSAGPSIHFFIFIRLFTVCVLSVCDLSSIIILVNARHKIVRECTI